MKSKGFPRIPEDLFRALEEAYPNRLSDDPKITLEDIRYAQGQQQVVTFLRRHFEGQNENILEIS